MKDQTTPLRHPGEDLAQFAFNLGGKKGCIPDKGTFYALWENGLLGNKPRSWKSMQAFRSSGYRGSVHFRYASPASPFRLADVPFNEIENKYWELINRGAQPELLRLSESIPADHITLHGHVQRSSNYYDLDYATSQDKLRDSRGMPEFHRFASGLLAKELLEHYLCPNSLEDLKEILDSFPDSVVELTAYDRDVGVLTGRNTIIWEVRNY